MSKSNNTVLCVDDEKKILNAMKRLLRKEDFRLLTCSSGEEALDLLSRTATSLHLPVRDLMFGVWILGFAIRLGLPHPGMPPGSLVPSVPTRILQLGRAPGC